MKDQDRGIYSQGARNENEDGMKLNLKFKMKFGRQWNEW
jgi:hypothetical protein